MAWWIWVLAGLVLLLGRWPRPGAFSSSSSGRRDPRRRAELSGWAGPAWAQWLVFSVLSVAALRGFRRRSCARFSLGKGKPVDQLVGEPAW